jgi:hypothetical protein
MKRKKPEASQERRHLLKALVGTAFAVPVMVSMSRDKLTGLDDDITLITFGKGKGVGKGGKFGGTKGKGVK